MKKRYNLILSFVFFSILSQAQPWQPLNHSAVRISVDDAYIIEAEEASYFSLDHEPMMELLRSAPSQNLRSPMSHQTIIQLPLSDGALQSFAIEEASVMEAGLQERFPMIRSYKGYAVDNPLMNVRINMYRNQMYAAIHSPEKIMYIDPQGKDLYISYDVHTVAYDIDPSIPMCGVDHAPEIKLEEKDKPALRTTARTTVPMHQYRLAISCTGEFGKWKGSVERVIADMVTGVNRMNQIFENELSMRLVLVDNNDQLLYFDPDTDPFNNTASGGAMLSVNTAVINNKIGAKAYDLGHVYSRACDVGGIASLGSMCSNIKGHGCTCHYRNDINYMAASVTSHEIGHQMSALHTFNNCGGNESLGNGFEPGSGSTIMSYGGLCGSNNVVSLGDDYYHGSSLEQIYGHLRDGGTADACAQVIPTENVAPIIELPYNDGFYIPTETYFYLDGSATDENNDALTYTWEQRNAGPQSPLGAPEGGAPNFRCYPPREESYRFFLSPKYILSNTGHRTEVLPKEEKLMQFKLVVRDNHPTGGIASWDEMRFWVTPNEGEEKFGLTSFKTNGAVLYPGQDTTITWDVAHTAGEKINCKSMDLYAFSGSTKDFKFENFVLVKKNMPNTGSASFKVPNFIANNVRFILKASNSIFFDISTGSASIQAPEEPQLHLDYNNALSVQCMPSTTEIQVNTYGYGGLTGMVEVRSVGDLPEGVSVELDKNTLEVGESLLCRVQAADDVPSQEFVVTLEATIDGAEKATTTYPIRFVNTDHSGITFTSPLPDQLGVDPNTNFSWTPSINAETYDLQVATSPSFDESSTVIDVKGLVDTSYISDILFLKNQAYYWKVVGQNQCGKDADPQIGAFATEVRACALVAAEDLPIAISSSGKPSVDVPIEVEAAGTVTSVGVQKVIIDHSNNKDLTLTLKNPSGHSAILVDRKCNQRNINCSFDDTSLTPVACPLNNQKTYKPHEPLSIFSDTEGKGTWTLNVKDNAPGNGGRIKGVVLELCTNASLTAPLLTVNNEMSIPPAATLAFYNWHLHAEDEDNTDAEIVYTMVTTPKKGTLQLYGDILSVGSTFTQEDLNNLAVYYTSGEEEGKDRFSFTIVDGEGGFVSLTDYSIDINKVHSVSTQESELKGISVYPIPTSSMLYIDLGSNTDVRKIELYDALGHRVRDIESHKRSVSVGDLPKGVYIMVFSTDTASVSKRVSIL